MSIKRTIQQKFNGESNNLEHVTITEGKISTNESNEIRELPENHKTGEKEYRFLNDSELSSLEPDASEFTQETCVIYLCMYKINEELEHPFLEYYFIKNADTGTFSFPKKVVDVSNNILEQIDIFHREYNKKENQDFIETSDEVGGPDDKIYKGYIIKENTIFAFYEYVLGSDADADADADATDIDVINEGYDKMDDEKREPAPAPAPELQKAGDSEPIQAPAPAPIDISNNIILPSTSTSSPEIGEPDSVWSILDEIIYKKTILTVSIDQEIIELFENNKKISTITDSEGAHIKIPYALYNVEIINDDFQNTFHENSDSKENTISFIENPITNFAYKHFGTIYLFSTEPINDEQNIQNIKRYVVFIDNPIYIPGIDLSEVSSDFIVSDYERPYNFTIDSKEFWTIKNNDLFIEI